MCCALGETNHIVRSDARNWRGLEIGELVDSCN